MTTDSPPGRRRSEAGIQRYSVSELNRAIGALLERGFTPRFLLDATVTRPQLKKGHLWMTLGDGDSSIGAVAWASRLARLTYRPADGDGVTVVGSLNFWAARASLTVQILDIRPSLTTVLRRFERVRALLEPEGLFAAERKRPLPPYPRTVAVLTSAPSSALADMERTAAERWPLARLLVVAIPVQGEGERQICDRLEWLSARAEDLELEALILARGGGNREDLALFDGERLARCLARVPVPVVTGIGHEDDTTICDLVADHRAATPTGAVVALLPDRAAEALHLSQCRERLQQRVRWRLQMERQQLTAQRSHLVRLDPGILLARERERLRQQRQVLAALSPTRVLRRGFSLVRDEQGRIVRSAQGLNPGQLLRLQLADGAAEVHVAPGS
ncbi:exodeoxyribonuclease VII large subunit [Synechococcus sp. RSCCF101]|uniref:exodeoxyribonuclease VII large subunit n=1 Tax=Synechococcus sp. RSCCF101 TaxID=2511069 RepID=UPI00124667C6|nr:exodeoxyribonuclease VII large subunit [Synechococcus sp. RSCCF101]QEY32940.1 exodeoxyribonuclease VII large subunit [Synechococcus sp. RSCCF101]